MKAKRPSHWGLCRAAKPESLYFAYSGGSRHRRVLCYASSPDELRKFKKPGVRLPSCKKQVLNVAAGRSETVNFGVFGANRVPEFMKPV